MKEINVYGLNDVTVYYTNKKVLLPKEYSDKVEVYWDSLKKSGKKFFNGKIFTITDIKNTSAQTEVFVELTDYAHFLYTIHKDTHEKHDCRVIYVSALIETSDKKYVIAEMNADTFAPGKLQFVGGGIDPGDVNGSIIDLKHSIVREIIKEIGIDVANINIVKSINPFVLKTGGKFDFISAVYKLDLAIDGQQLLDNFHTFNQEQISNGFSPELKSLVLVDANPDSVTGFLDNDTREKDENLASALRTAVGLIKG